MKLPLPVTLALLWFAVAAGSAAPAAKPNIIFLLTDDQRDNPFQEGIRTPRWKYIRMYDGVNNFLEHHVDFRRRAPEFELLFDLAADPGERTNLAADPAHAAVLADLRTKVAAESVARNERRATYVRTFPPAPRPKPASPKAGK